METIIIGIAAIVAIYFITKQNRGPSDDRDIHIHIHNSSVEHEGPLEVTQSPVTTKSKPKAKAKEIPIEEPDRTTNWLQKEITDSN